MSNYNTLIKGTTISASDMNNNFDHCFAGDWLPLSGATLTTDTTETLDMGSVTKKWDTLYCNNLNIDGEIKNAFNLIAEYNLTTATVSTIEITGLNGDKDEVWLVYGRFVAGTAGIAGIEMYFNNDSATNYGYQILYGRGSSALASRNQPRAGINIGNVVLGTTTAINSFSESFVYCKSGNERTVITESNSFAGETYISDRQILGQIWNNTTDTITSIKVVLTTNTALRTGTNLQIWAKTTTITARAIDPTTT